MQCAMCRFVLRSSSGYYKDTGIQGNRDTRIQGYKDTRIQGYKDTRIQGW